MALSVGELEVLLKLKDELTPALKHAGNESRKFGEVWKGVQLGAGIQLWNTLSHKIMEVGSHLSKMGIEGAKLIAVEKEFKTLADAAGNGEGALEALAKGFRGTVDEADLMQAALKPLSLGLKISNENMTLLGQASRVLAVRMGGDALSSFSALSRAIAIGNERLLRRAGLTISSQKAVQDYAAAHHKVVDALTEVEKKEAKREAILAKLRETLKNSGEKEMDLAENMKRVHAAMKDLEESFAKAIASNASLNILVTGLVDIFVQLTAVFKAGGGAQSLVTQGAILAAKGFVGLATAMSFTSDRITEMKILMLGVYNTVLDLSIAMAKASIAMPWTSDEARAGYEQDIVLLKAEQAANVAAVDAAVTANTDRVNSIETVKQSLVKLEKAVTDADGKLVKVAVSGHGAGEGVAKAGAEAEKAAASYKKFSVAISKELMNALAQSTGGLQGEFMKIAATIKEKMAQIAEDQKQGWSSEHIAAAKDKVNELSAALQNNAVESAKQSMIGQTFEDITVAAENYRFVLQKIGELGQHITPAGLAQLEKYLIQAVKDGQPLAGDLAAVQAKMEDLGYATEETTKHHESYTEAIAYQQSLSEAAAAAEQERFDKVNRGLNDLIGLLGVSTELLDAMGVSSSSTFGSIVGGAMASLETISKLINAETTMQQIQALISQAAGIMRAGANAKSASGAALGGAMSGAMTGFAIGGPIGAGIGAVGGALLGLFGRAKAAREAAAKLKVELKGMQDEFIKSMGGLDALKSKAKEAGISIDAMMSAKNKEQMLKAINEIKDKLDTFNEAQEAVNDAIKRYGFTIDELGPKWAQQQLDTQAAQLLKDYKLLTAAGVDHNAILNRMGPDFNAYVNEVIKGGGTIPIAMKPAIDELIKNGQLLDENGEAYTSAQDAGITFAETMGEAMTRAADAIEKLVKALLGIDDAIPSEINIPVNTGGGGAGPRGRPTESYAAGTGGLRKVKKDMVAMVHAGEGLLVLTGQQMSSVHGFRRGTDGTEPDEHIGPRGGGDTGGPTDAASPSAPASAETVTAAVERAIAAVAKDLMTARPVSVQYTVAPSIIEDPLASKERREDMRQFTVDQIKTMVRSRDPEFMIDLRRALQETGAL